MSPLSQASDPASLVSQRKARQWDKHSGALRLTGVTDDALITRFLVHDEEAWRPLVGRYTSFIYSIAIRGFRIDAEEAREVVQESLLKLFEGLSHAGGYAAGDVIARRNGKVRNSRTLGFSVVQCPYLNNGRILYQLSSVRALRTSNGIRNFWSCAATTGSNPAPAGCGDHGRRAKSRSHFNTLKIT